jgi:hypothetical protein
MRVGETSRKRVTRERRKSSDVKKKILDSCTKLSTILFKKKKDGEAIVSHFAVLHGNPELF